MNLLFLFPDGIDGKQARRTGSSTPLGELFDHGSDSVVACILPPALFCIFGRGEIDYGANVWTLYWVCWHIIGCFALSHWEKYLTGVLYLPWAYDISQVVCFTLHHFKKYVTHSIKMRCFSARPQVEIRLKIPFLFSPQF